MWQESCFMWHEMANCLSAIDMYVLSLACKAGRKNYMHVFPHAVFDVTDRHACTLQFLESIGCKQCVDEADNTTIHNIRRIIEYEVRPCKRRV